MNLKKQLRLYLDQKEMSAARLAKLANVPKQSLSGWLLGSNPRNVAQIKRVADVLGTTVDHLIFGDGIENLQKRHIELDALLGDDWVGGLFEIRLRRVKGHRVRD